MPNFNFTDTIEAMQRPRENQALEADPTKEEWTLLSGACLDLSSHYCLDFSEECIPTLSPLGVMRAWASSLCKGARQKQV